MCQDCIKFLTDAQAEAKANSSFINSLIQNIESQCDLLGPGLSDMVSGPKTADDLAFIVKPPYLQCLDSVFMNLQCKQYVGQYGPVVVQQLMSMVSLVTVSHD